MLLYLIIPILIVVFYKKINTNKINGFDITILSLMILVCGLRYNVGTDYGIYTRMFEYTNLFTNTEFLFIELIKVIKNIFGNDVRLFFFITSLITHLLFYLCIKKTSKKPAFSIFLYVCLGYYAHGFNTIRQMIAIGISLIAVQFIEKKKLVPYIITTTIAGFIHTTAFIMLPMYFVGRMKLNKKTLTILFILMFTAVFSYQPLLQFITTKFVKYSAYSQINHYTFSEAGIGTYVIAVIHIILALIIIIKRDLLIKKNKFNQTYINFIIFSLFFYLLSLSNTVAVRPGYYFSIFLIYLIPDFINDIFKVEKNKFQLMIAILFICYYILHLVSFNSMLPYQTFI